MKKLITLFVCLSFITSCQEPKEIREYGLEDLSIVFEKVSKVVESTDIEKIQKNRNYLIEIRREYCVVAPDKFVRILIVSDLVSDDSLTNRIIKRSDSSLIQPIQNKAISSLLQLRKLDQEPFEVIMNKLHESPTYSEIMAGRRKFKQLSNVNITDEDLYQVSRVMVVFACGTSSLKLALIGEKIPVVDELTKSLINEYVALSIDIDTKNAEKLLQESQRLLNSLY